MGKRLTDEQIKTYHDEGWASPIRVMSADDATAIRRQIEDFEARQGAPLRGPQKSKGYLLFPALFDMVSRPEVLDAIEDVIGENILLYQNGAWFKEPESASYVSWHQDSTYYGMDPLKLVTAWVALSPATREMGCLHVLAGSHKLGQLPVDYSEVTEENLLSSGQNTLVDKDAYKTVVMELEPGEMSMHHCATVHSSLPNHGNERRVGFSMAFVPPDVRQTTKTKASAMLLRGRDDFGNYPLTERPPVSADDPDTIAHHQQAVKLYRDKTVECGNQTAWQRIG